MLCNSIYSTLLREFICLDHANVTVIELCWHKGIVIFVKEILFHYVSRILFHEQSFTVIILSFITSAMVTELCYDTLKGITLY